MEPLPITNKGQFILWADHAADTWDWSKVALVQIKQYRKPSHSMIKTWRMWMQETAQFMAANGVTMPGYLTAEGKAVDSRPFSPDDAHELFVRRYCGVDENGERETTSYKGDKGKMLHMMDSHLAWATEKGLSLTVPQGGEYKGLSDE